MEYRKLPKGEERSVFWEWEPVPSELPGKTMLVRSAAWMRSQITSTNNYSQKQSITV